MTSQSNLRGALLAMLSFSVYATSDAMVKYIGASYSPFQNIFFSVLFSFPLVTLLLVSDRSEENLIPRFPVMTLARSAITVVNALCGFYAFAVLPLSEAYSIFFASPLLITLFAIPMLGEKVGLHRSLAIVVGLAGVLIVMRPGQAHVGLGHLAALAAATLFAVNSVLVRKAGQSERSVVIMLYPMLANFVVTAVALPFVYQPMPIEHLGLIAAMSALGFAGGLLSIAAYRRAPAVIVAPMQYLQIIWATIYGTLIFHEGHDVWTAAGSAVIIASGIYIVLREDKPEVSVTRPVLQTGSHLDPAATARMGFFFRLFEARLQRKSERDDHS